MDERKDDFTQDDMARHVEQIENQGVRFKSEGIKRIRTGWHVVQGELSDPMFDSYNPLFRKVAVLFLNIGNTPATVRFVNCTGEFERKMEWKLNSLDEIPDYSDLTLITRSDIFVSKETGSLFNLNR